MTNTDGSRQAVTVESDEVDAQLPTAADIAALTGGGGGGAGRAGGGMSCASGGGRGGGASALDF
jgi:hypothetical protein